MKRMKLRGTMLIMVAAVMLILIIFCLATFAMVSSANKRAYLKFEDNQSYYTAASALDVFASGMMSDGVLYSYNVGTGGVPDTSSPRKYYDETDSDHETLTQGRALELDMYKLAVLAGSASPTTLIGAGKAGTNAFFTGTNAPLNLIINGEEDCFSATAGTTYATQFAATSASAPTPYKYAEYILDMPGVSSSGSAFSATDSYGLFADPVVTGSGTATKTTYPAKITVEMIERYYNMQGVDYKDIKAYMDTILNPTDYTDAEIDALADKVKSIFGSGYTAGINATYVPNNGEIKTLIQNGDRTKDYLHIKVTAETTLMGVTGTAAREFIISTPMPASNGNAITNFGINTSGATMSSVGGISSLISFKSSTAGNAGAVFSAGTLNYEGYNSSQAVTKNIAEDTVKPDSKTPYVTALDRIFWNDDAGEPPVLSQGHNTIFYSANGFERPAANTFGSATAMYHIITGGEFKAGSPVTIHGTVTADSFKSTNPVNILKDSNNNYGRAYFNKLTVSDANYITADNGIYANDLFIGQLGDGLDNATLMGGANDGLGDVSLGFHDDTDTKNDHPYVIELNSGITLNYSGYVYLANDTATPPTKYIIEADSASSTRFYVYRDDNPSDKQSIIVAVPGSVATYPPLGTAGGTFIRNPGNAKIAVNYYSPTDYTMTADYKKEFTLPFDFYDGSGSPIGSLANTARKIQVDTPQSLYKDYLSGVIYGTGAGVDNNSDGLIDNGGDGAIAAVYTADSNGDGVLDSAPKDIYYGVLDGNYEPLPAIVYNNDDTEDYNPAVKNITTKPIGYAKSGGLTAFAGIFDGVMTAAEKLKSIDSTFDGTTLDVFPTTYATIDETPGTYAASATDNISYSGIITSDGKLPDDESVFIPQWQGAKVYLVDTVGKDITLQFPKLVSGREFIYNIMLVPIGTGKLNLIIPDRNLADASQPVKLGDYGNASFIAATPEIYCLSGFQTSGGKIASRDPTKAEYYVTGSNASTPTDAGKITVLVGNNADLKFENGSFIGGVVYAPESKVTMESTYAPEANAYFNYAGATPVPNNQETKIMAHIAGNLVCNGFTTSDTSGVLFLPSDTPLDPGLPNFSWKSTRYLSGR